MNKLFQGDCIFIRSQVEPESVDLIYLDPPFNTGKDWGEFDDRWDSLEDYIAFLRARVVELYKLLKPTGSFYLHCDPTASHYIKVMLDEVFGRKQFRNEIVWGYKTGGVSTVKSFSQKHDIVLFYTTSNSYNFNMFTQVSYSHTLPTPGTSSGKSIEVCVDSIGQYRNVMARDWWVEYGVNRDEDITPLYRNSAERIGYPTQKPIALLERIIKASSNPGDIVLDPFCGSGTTCVAAKRLGRQYIGSDINPKAIEITRERLANETERELKFES